jgi:hypothetical protein
MRRLAAILTIIGVCANGAALAAEQPVPVLDVAAVPYLDAAARAKYASFLLLNLPRAMAIASNGWYGGWGGGGTMENARAQALKLCTDRGGADCAVYAEDLQVVWRGQSAVLLPAVPGPLIETRDYAFVPDARYIWHGPQAARGVYVWAHGKGNAIDSRGAQPQAHVRAFNNAGFDIVRFDRSPTTDYVDAAADWLRKGLASLRTRGWHMVIAGGQSRGAWNSLQALDTPGLVDAVIAISPASFSGVATQEADLWRILHAARSPSARVAVVQFKGDPYVRDMSSRIAMLREALQTHAAASLVIDQPEGFTGHGGGGAPGFATRFAPCLLRFVTDPQPPTACTPPST